MTADVTGRLTGRTVVVTGSSSGNGRAIATAMAAAGAAVVCADLTSTARADGFEADKDVDTDELIRRSGGNAIFHGTDISSESDQQALLDHAVSEFGRVDVWVNNAGIGTGFGEIQQLDVADLEKALQVNLVGTWLGCRVAVTQMLKQDIRGRCRGRIINMGSVTGDAGQAMLGIYTMTKGGVHALTRQLAIEVAAAGINVNALAPGYIPTGMNRPFWDDPAALEDVKRYHPWFELARREDVAGPAVFLASDEAAYITGVVLPIDGGALAR